MNDIKILDACCGGRMFWFDKKEKHTTFMDIRDEFLEFLDRGKTRIYKVNPDIIADFRVMPFESEMFNLVVFDPPHLINAGKNSWLVKKYGRLDEGNWEKDLEKGFTECMRVLKIGGTLVFKWSDVQIKVKDLLRIIPFKPLFGQQRGKTHWMVFVKFEEKS